MKHIFWSGTRWQFVRQLYTLLTLMSFLTVWHSANAQNVSGYTYTAYTSVDAGTWNYGAISNPFTVTYSGDVWNTKTVTTYTPVSTPTALSNYVQPTTMLELGAYVNGTPPSVALFTFTTPLRAGTVMFIQDVDALESFTFEFIDSDGNVLNPSLIGTYNLSNPARSSFTLNSTMLTVTGTDNFNYAESLSDFVINSSLVKQVRITQIASRDTPSASGTAEFYFSVAPVPTIVSGNVWNDADGSLAQNGAETGTNTGGTLYVNLVDGTGTVIGSTTVSASGSYSLTAPASTTGLKLVLTSTASSTTPGSLPTGWVNTGENVGATNTATQSTSLGQIELTTSTGAITAQNFGIEVLPTPGSGTATVANSGGTSVITAPPSAFTNVTPSADTAPGSVTAIHITGFPSNVTSLTINGTTYTAATFPAGGVLVPTTSTGAPTVPILVDPTNDANPVVFTYKAVDNAGKASTTTGTATLNFPALPPDLTPIIYARPSTIYNTTNMTVVVDVVELLNVPTSGLITVRVTKDAKVSLTFPSLATTIGGHLVQNSAWTVDAVSNVNYYILTTNQVVLAGAKLSFGFTGVMTPGATTGKLTLSTVIVGGSGGEVRINNNVDADLVDYFQQ